MHGIISSGGDVLAGGILMDENFKGNSGARRNTLRHWGALTFPKN